MSTDSVCPCCGRICLACGAEEAGDESARLLVRHLLAELAAATRPRGAPIGRGKGVGNARRAREAAEREIGDWRRIEGVLATVPALPLRDIVGLLHGPPNRMMTAKRQANATGQTLRRLVERGLLVRVRPGWYALADGRRGPPVGGREAVVAVLARERLTAAEIARKFGVSGGVVQHWLEEIRRRGHPLRFAVEAGDTHPRRRYWVEPVKKKVGRPRKDLLKRRAA